LEILKITSEKPRETPHRGLMHFRSDLQAVALNGVFWR
jgi:hypothetical protein